jgi:hypothetical protein
VISKQVLLDESEAATALSLNQDDLAWLVDTGQLLPISIRGKKRFLLSDIEQLITTYQSVQRRGKDAAKYSKH